MRYDGIGMGGPFGALVMFGLAVLGLLLFAAWVHSMKPKETEAIFAFTVNVCTKAIYLAIAALFSLAIALIPAKFFDLQGGVYLTTGAIIFVGLLIWQTD